MTQTMAMQALTEAYEAYQKFECAGSAGRAACEREAKEAAARDAAAKQAARVHVCGW